MMRKIFAIIIFTCMSQRLVFAQEKTVLTDPGFSGDLNKATPGQFLGILSSGFDPLNKMNFVSTGDFPKDWIKPEDVNFLMKQIHSEEKCKCIVKVWSSYLPIYDYSTVGGQAMNMIESYKNHVPYYPGLWNCAKNDSLRAKEIETWWKSTQQKTDTEKNDDGMSSRLWMEQKGVAITDTLPKVTGIGGIFFRSENPDSLKKWYGKNLGLKINEYGSVFEFHNANRPDEINYLEWSPFDEGTSYFNPSRKEFMINYRVQNIEGLLEKLKRNGVIVLDSIESYEHGKFVHIMDPEGNKIELWEPIDSVLTRIGGETTK